MVVPPLFCGGASGFVASRGFSVFLTERQVGRLVTWLVPEKSDPKNMYRSTITSSTRQNQRTGPSVVKPIPSSPSENRIVPNTNKPSRQGFVRRFSAWF